MANQIDLVTVVRNMLADVREKTAQLNDAQVALDSSRTQLVESQKDLSDYIKTVNELATEITSELSSTNLAEVKEEAVADSLKADEPVKVETVTKDVEPAKIAVSDESPTSEVKASTSSSKSASSRVVTPELDAVIEDNSESVSVEKVADEIAEPAPKVDSPKATVASKKVAAPEKKVDTSPVGGLWDDDDDEVF